MNTVLYIYIYIYYIYIYIYIYIHIYYIYIYIHIYTGMLVVGLVSSGASSGVLSNGFFPQFYL